MKDRMRRKLLNIYIIIAGGILLAYYGIGNQSWRHDRKIVISAELQMVLSNEFERTWQRSPSELEFDQLLNNIIRKELAYREATSLELGRDDVIIRRRLQQLLESRSADDALRTPATQDDLQRFLDEHADVFQVDPLVTFRQIHFDITQGAIVADATARFILGKLQNQENDEDISNLGDPSALPFVFEGVRSADIVPIFGQEFTNRLSAAAVGEWVGPIPSTLGLHLIHVDKKAAGRLPQLEEIEDSVREAWLSAKRKTAINEMYRELAEQYKISIDAQTAH